MSSNPKNRQIEGITQPVSVQDMIELSGFTDVDSADKHLLKSNVEAYVKKMGKKLGKLEKISLHLKKVHMRERSEKYELQARILFDGRVVSSHVTEFNLLKAVDDAMQKLSHEIERDVK